MSVNYGMSSLPVSAIMVKEHLLVACRQSYNYQYSKHVIRIVNYWWAQEDYDFDNHYFVSSIVNFIEFNLKYDGIAASYFAINLN